MGSAERVVLTPITITRLLWFQLRDLDLWVRWSLPFGQADMLRNGEANSRVLHTAVAYIPNHEESTKFKLLLFGSCYLMLECEGH
jgi:hypothetical protein